MITEAPIQRGAKMRRPMWVRLVLLSILLGSAAAGGAQTRPVAPVNNRPPVGSLDQIDTKGQVAGWSADDDRPSSPVQVVLAVDGVVLATVAANVPRPDVTAAFPKFVGNHGFVFTLPVTIQDGKPHTIQAWAIDDDGQRVELAASPKVFRVGAAVSLPATAPPGKPGTPLRGDCSSEGGLAARTDLVFCEPWEVDTWWQAGYQGDGTKSIDRPADTNAIFRSSLVSTNCIYGKCLKLDMLKGETRALMVHWPLARAGLAPEELYLRYYLRLGATFNVYSGDATGKVVGRGGKLPGLADVRTTGDPRGQCGNGGDTADGINCWSMRAEFDHCYRACNTKPGASMRFGSYLYFYQQEVGEGGSFTGRNGNWDSGGITGKGCQTVPTNTDCGIGDGGVLLNDRWYRIEMHVKMNTPGQADGVIEGKVDGVLSYQKKNMIFRIPGHDNLHVRTIWLDVFKGGTVGNLNDQQVYLDQMVAALKDWVGPWVATSTGR
jgi:hypothetical protein